MADEKAPKPIPKQLLNELNDQTAQRLSQRTGSFFFPQFNGPDDPNGFHAFEAGNLGPTDQFARTALAQATAEKLPNKSVPRTGEQKYIPNSGVIFKDPVRPFIQSYRPTREDRKNELLRERERIEKRLRELSRGNVGKKTREQRKLLYGRLKQINSKI